MEEDRDDHFVSFQHALAKSINRCADGFLGTIEGSTGGAEFEFEEAVRLLPERWHDDARAHFDRGLPLCESPIERRLFPWLLCQPYSNFEHRPFVRILGDEGQIPPFTVAVVPQFKIGNRRADFALAARRHGPVRFVVIECDGEAFHQDVLRDIKRDAELLRWRLVLDVHAFTGKEITHGPRVCARIASRAVTNAWARTNSFTQHKFGSS